MTIIVDAGPVITLFDRRDPLQDVIGDLLESEPAPLVLSAYVAAEVDYMIQQRYGAAAERAFLTELVHGRFELALPTPSEHRVIAELAERYSDLPLGLADLSLVVLADRYRTNRIATFDQRHFRLLQPLAGGSFTLLPFDLDQRTP